MDEKRTIWDDVIMCVLGAVTCIVALYLMFNK